MPELHHKTISQGRKTVIFGLSWYTVEGEDSPRKAGAALAREISHPVDYIVVRKGEMPQFGLASGNEGAKAGNIAAAGVVAEIVGSDSWIYVMEIESSIWICSGRDGFVLPEGDQIYDDLDTAREAFEALQPETFKKLHLPPSWKTWLLGDSERELGDLAGDIETTDVIEFIEYEPPGWAKLTPLSPAGVVIKFGSLLVLAASVFYGGQYFLEQSQMRNAGQDRRAAVEAGTRAEILRNRQSQLARFAELDAIRPWHDAPVAADVYTHCMQAIRDMPASPVGYQVDEITCNGRAIQARLSRTTGFPSWLQEWADDYPALSVSTSPDGSQGALTRPLARMQPRGAEQIAPFQQTSQEMLQYAQIEGGGMNLTSPAAAAIPEEPEYVPYYATSTYEIETMRPGTWEPLLSRTPGLTIDRITYTTNDDSFTMEGELYVPNL